MNNLIEEIYIYKKNVRLAKKTIVNYSTYLNKFVSFLSEYAKMNPEKIHLDKFYLLTDKNGKIIKYLPIDCNVIDQYFLSIQDKSYNILKDNYKSLKSFFKFLENNYSFNNPMMYLNFKLKDFLPEIKYSKILTRGNVLKLLNSILRNSTNLETELLLFSLLITTGCRISEILGLKCRDIDFEEESFLLEKTKNKHERIVFLRPGMGKSIMNYIKKYDRKESDYLILNEQNKKYSRSEVDKLLKEFLKFANLPSINIHSIRHTFATLLAEQGTDKLIISQLLGHESLIATETYINPHYVRNEKLKESNNDLIINFIKKKI